MLVWSGTRHPCVSTEHGWSYIKCCRRHPPMPCALLALSCACRPWAVQAGIRTATLLPGHTCPGIRQCGSCLSLPTLACALGSRVMKGTKAWHDTPAQPAQSSQCMALALYMACRASAWQTVSTILHNRSQLAMRSSTPAPILGTPKSGCSDVRHTRDTHTTAWPACKRQSPVTSFDLPLTCHIIMCVEAGSGPPPGP